MPILRRSVVQFCSAPLVRFHTALDSFPQFRFEDDETCVYDSWSGYVESGRAVSVMASIAREAGAVFRENTPVTGIEERGAGVEVAFEGGREVFDSVVVATGA